MKTSKINKIPDQIDRELRHYFQFEDFGPKSPCMEVLSFGTYDISPPKWPHGADHRIMMRVKETLLLAEGHIIDNLKLEPEFVMSTKSKIYNKKERPEGLEYIELDSLESAGTMPVLAAYYGRYGLMAQTAGGTLFDNTKGRAEPMDAILAVYPLTGEPLGQRSAERARDRIEAIKQDIQSADGLRKSLWKHTHNKAVDLLNMAHRSYCAARELRENNTGIFYERL